MSNPPEHEIVENIERFAELCAWLDDPFTDRSAVLRALGLDAARWRRIEDQWMARLINPAAEALVLKFGDVYASTRTSLMCAPADTPAPAAPDPRFLSAEAQPWREEAAQVGKVVEDAPPTVRSTPPPAAAPPRAPGAPPHAGTLDVDMRRLRPALPFVAGASSALPPSVPAPPSPRTGTLDAPKRLGPPPVPFGSPGATTPPPPHGATLELGAVLQRPRKP
jgi:hypothetical protein